jgi:hypothetical protein
MPENRTVWVASLNGDYMGDKPDREKQGFPERYWFHIGESPVLSQPGIGRLGRRGSGPDRVRDDDRREGWFLGVLNNTIRAECPILNWGEMDLEYWGGLISKSISIKATFINQWILIKK